MLSVRVEGWPRTVTGTFTYAQVRLLAAMAALDGAVVWVLP